MRKIYTYTNNKGIPYFDKIGSVSTVNDDYKTSGSITCAMKFSLDHKLLMSSVAGSNSVAIFKVDEKTAVMLRAEFFAPGEAENQ